MFHRTQPTVREVIERSLLLKTHDPEDIINTRPGSRWRRNQLRLAQTTTPPTRDERR